MVNEPVTKIAGVTLQSTKIPVELLKQFQTEAEFIRIPPGSIAGLIRVSPDMIAKMGAAELTKVLEQAGCERSFEDKASGSRVDRPGLSLALEVARKGDTLVVWKLDRLGRSVKQLVELVEALRKRGIEFKSLTDNIDTGSPSGRFFFHVMASLAQMERELIVERTRAGLAAAKQLGTKSGRKRKMTDSKIATAKKLLAGGMPPKDVANSLGVSIPTLYRWIPAPAKS